MTDTAQDGLFPALTPTLTAAEPVEKLSADRRRTLRQRALVEAGIHPHTRNAARPDLGTCGDCRFRVLEGHHNRTYPKCEAFPGLVTHGAGSDVRAWWPACSSFESNGTRP